VLVGVGGVVIVTIVVETAASAVRAKRRSAMLVGRRCIVRLVSYTSYTKKQMTGNGLNECRINDIVLEEQYGCRRLI
jgi:hypothetical protein